MEVLQLVEGKPSVRRPHTHNPQPSKNEKSMLLLAEIAIILLLSSLLSTPESFTYLFATYIIVKIARSWFKGCLPAALGGGSDDEDYDLLGTYVIAYCHIIL